MKTLATIIALSLPAIALAEPLRPMPQPKIGAACPSGYQSSGGACVPGPVTQMPRVPEERRHVPGRLHHQL
jgi:hypothetical protein